MDQVIIDAPSSVTTSYLVATHFHVGHPQLLIIPRLRELLADEHPLAETALELLRSDSCTLTQLEVASSGRREDLQDVLGEQPALRAIQAARYHQVLTVEAAVAALPKVAQAMRLIARTLAFVTGGVFVDLAGRIVLADRHPALEPSAFTVSACWVTIVINHGHDPDSLSAQTWGLSRFGLPELGTSGFGQPSTLTAFNLLAGISTHLLDGQWAYLASRGTGPTRALPSRLDLDVAWVYRFYDLPPATAGTLPLQLRPVSSTPADGLHVLPAGGTDADLARWWRTQVSAVIPDLHPKSGRNLR
ncbi:hypothetical protein [Actinomadura hibisca]|uniref:hypothetical protein n=1 Tax=Actinomadura hibisca TaxID=68565 RepID=UPI00082CC728|nr:hypothetical protein [Actinomadura hibisca]